jgi:hypothetical protein
MSEKNIKRAVKLKLIVGCPVTYEAIKDLSMRFCYACQLGRMRAAPVKPPTGKEYAPLECIAVDYKGPILTQSVHHCTGFYLISDHKTGGVWSYPCVNKGEDTLCDILSSFFNFTVEPSKFESRIFHCDCDTVILGGKVSDYIKSRKLDLRASTPYAHHQNGQVERAMQTVLDKTRTLLAASRAPRKYWDYALQMATYLIVRTPNRMNQVSPFETLTGEPPDMSRLVPFLAPGVYHLTKEERHSTWDYKAKLCRMLGYDEIIVTATRS